MIRVKNLSKIYEGDTYKTTAINDISFEIKEGEFVSIMGASGSGKSTLLNILGLMDESTKGEYYLNDIPIHESKTIKLDKIRKENICFVFQHFALMNQYTVYENIELPLCAKNVEKKKRKETIKKYMEMLEIEELKSKYPTQISGGQQQRVAIARALASNNNFILADEPTGALDHENSQSLIDILKKINEMGKTIIVVTHNKEVAESTNRIITLCDGKILEDINIKPL